MMHGSDSDSSSDDDDGDLDGVDDWLATDDFARTESLAEVTNEMINTNLPELIMTNDRPPPRFKDRNLQVLWLSLPEMTDVTDDQLETVCRAFEREEIEPLHIVVRGNVDGEKVKVKEKEKKFYVLVSGVLHKVKGFDTTGDGKVDAVDTTGDGNANAFDTIGDGEMNKFSSKVKKVEVDGKDGKEKLIRQISDPLHGHTPEAWLFQGHHFGEETMRNGNLAESHHSTVIAHTAATVLTLSFTRYTTLVKDIPALSSLFDCFERHHEDDYIWKNEIKRKLVGVPWLVGGNSEIDLRGKKSSPRRRRRTTRRTRVSHKVKKGKADSGKRMINQYVVQRKLGQGSFGTVMLAVDTSPQGPLDYDPENPDRLFAIKEVKRNVFGTGRKVLHRDRRGVDLDADLAHEIAILKKMRHPNIVMLYEVIDDADSNKVYQVVEYLSEGSVLPEELVVEPIPPKRCWHIFRDTLQGMHYLHFQHVAHRDLKPSNILLNDRGVAKIADFGTSMKRRAERLIAYESKGTPLFMAPECLGEKHARVTQTGLDGIVKSAMEAPKSPRVLPKEKRKGFRNGGDGDSEEDGSSSEAFDAEIADMYSLGATLYQMVFGFPPHTAPTIQALVDVKSIDMPVYFPSKPADPSLRHLLSSLLEVNPVKRLTLDEARKHPWVTLDGTHPMRDETYETVLVTKEDMTRAFSIAKVMHDKTKTWLERARNSIFMRKKNQKEIAQRKQKIANIVMSAAYNFKKPIMSSSFRVRQKAKWLAEKQKQDKTTSEKMNN
eukprot:g2627.t1